MNMDAIGLCKNAVAWIKSRTFLTSSVSKIGLSNEVDIAHNRYFAKNEAAASEEVVTQPMPSEKNDNCSSSRRRKLRNSRL